MNIFEQYGIKEVADVTLYAIELDENDDEIYIPVLYMDTLKVSTVEESSSQANAQGGIGNPKLITWDYGKDITVTLEDALFTPASASMNWGGKLGVKGLQLYLSHFYDRNTDNNTPNTCLRTATLTVEKFSDFFIIPDRWPPYSKKRAQNEEDECSNYSWNKEEKIGNVGETSIFCWLVSGYIVSSDNKKRVSFENEILMYREITQRWHTFNYWSLLDESEKDVNKFLNYGKEAFEYLKQLVDFKESVETVTWDEHKDYNNSHDGMEELPPFLSYQLYIDGYRPGCGRTKKYSDISPEEQEAFNIEEYAPYRFFAYIGVEYNTNIAPPQEAMYITDTAYKDVELLERIEKCCATATFCIDTDINTQHGQYRYLTKYSQTELTVYIDPNTMQPYRPNSYIFYRKNGQKVTGNLRIIKCGEYYYKWTREKASTHNAVGKQIIIDSHHFPGTYRLVGETYKRNRYGEDKHYQFEIPLCKLHADNKLTLQSDGDPTVFSMKLTALRRYDGVMMKLTEYDTIKRDFHSIKSDSEKIVPFIEERIDPGIYAHEYGTHNNEIDLPEVTSE